MVTYDDPAEGCRHDRAPLQRLGKIIHERSGKSVYVLLCPVCGFTVTTDQLRQLKKKPRKGSNVHAPRWAPGRPHASSC